MRVVVQRLENALRLVILRDAIHQTVLSYVARARPERTEAGKAGAGRKPPPTVATVLKRHRSAIVKRVHRQTQEQFPNMGKAESKREVERAYDRYLEQAQVQAQTPR